LHGRLPRFQIPSATMKLPAAAPPSAGEYASCNSELAHVASPAVTIAGVGEGVGVADGEALGSALGSGEGTAGDGVLNSGLEVGRTGAAPAHAATAAVSTAVSTTSRHRPRLDVLASELPQGSDIVDAVTRVA
jgi:hypothetical protein